MNALSALAQISNLSKILPLRYFSSSGTGVDRHIIIYQNFPYWSSQSIRFLNGAAKVMTEMEMVEFKDYLKNIEERLKRDRTAPKYGPELSILTS